MSRESSKWFLIFVLAIDAAITLNLAFGERVRLFIANGQAGCWPWSPAVVELRPGMTICPGQTARGTFTIKAKDHDI